MKLQFIMNNGTTIAMDPPPDFNFLVTCMSIRAAGYFMNGTIYIDHSKVNAIVFGDQQVEMKPSGVTMQ